MKIIRQIDFINSFPKTGIAYRIVSNFSWSIISEVTGKFIFFITNIYLARILTVDNYGFFTLAQSMVLYFWLAADLGINMYGSKEIAKDKINISDIVNPLLSLRILSGFAVFIIFISILYFLHYNSIQKWLFVGSAFYLITRSISIEWVMRGLEKFEYIALSNSITFISMFLLTILFVKDDNDLIKAAFLQSFCYLLGGIPLFLIFHNKFKFKFAFDIKKWGLHLKESLHFTISGGLSVLIQYLPIIYLGIFATAQDIGVFSASYRLISAILFVVSILPMSLYPIFSELYFNKKEKFKKIHIKYVLLSFFVGFNSLIFGYVFAENIILTLFGDKYYESISLFKILLWHVFLYSIKSPYGIVIAASGLQKYQTIALSFGILFFTVNFFVMKHIFKLSCLISVCICYSLTELAVSLILIFFWRVKNEIS